MSATEDLRRMLDERGVKYDVRDGKAIKNTYWNDAEGRRWGYTSDESGAIKDRQLFLVRGRMDITPEQAVEATVGRWTCQIETTENWLPAERYHRCKECGAFFAVLDASHDIPPRYCPNCGRRIEVDE